MKSTLLIVLGVALCACLLHDAAALPLEPEEALVGEAEAGAAFAAAPAPPAEHSGGRQKRATCDLLSGFGVNNSACAAHCIARFNKGGYCNSKGVCVCRK